jgi:hypothetical protein
VVRRRPSRALKSRLSQQPVELPMLWQIVLWPFKSEVRAVLVMAILFAIGMGAGLVARAGSQAVEFTVLALAALLIFGVFLGVIAVTEGSREHKVGGSKTRVVCGVVALSAISVIFGAPLEGVCFAALLGAMLGYTSPYWARYI